MVENHKDDAHAAKEVDFPDSVALAPRREGDSNVLAYQRIFFYALLHKMNIALLFFNVKRRPSCEDGL